MAQSDAQFEAYFKNDSVNGLKVSDGYETHNMGVIYKRSDVFFQLDLGIVSPDMHVYKNQFRVANRAFGEIVSLSVGRQNQTYKDLELSYYLNLKTAGEYGIDSMQDWMHRVLALQPVNKVNDIVRMPNKVWVGVGGATVFDFPSDGSLFDNFGANLYFGTDRIELSPYVKNSNLLRDFKITQELGLQLVPFNDIVSAPPIAASHRRLIPYIEIGLEFEVGAAEFFVRDRFSLPTIEDDNSIFGILYAGVNIQFD